MQGLFSSFPGGWPGLGLLLLRGGVGAVIVTKSLHSITLDISAGAVVVVAIGAGAGLLLILGLLTPYAGLVLSVDALMSWLLPASAAWSDRDAVLLVVVTSASLALVGPGRHSMDARLFGRREIIVAPPTSRRPV